MSDLKLNAMIPSDDMKREVLIQLLQSKGLGSYGTKTEMVDRYKKVINVRSTTDHFPAT